MGWDVKVFWFTRINLQPATKLSNRKANENSRIILLSKFQHLIFTQII